jgi:MSHA pilin protein MshD
VTLKPSYNRKVLHRSGGFTFIELTISIVIIAIAGASIVGLTSRMAAQSAGAMQRLQATEIADTYMQEILSKPVTGPAGGAGRAQYSRVDDYLLLPDTLVRDYTGALIPGFSAYRVAVQIAQTPFVAIPTAQVRRITVTVTDPQGSNVSISAFKTAP